MAGKTRVDVVVSGTLLGQGWLIQDKGVVVFLRERPRRWLVMDRWSWDGPRLVRGSTVRRSWKTMRDAIAGEDA